MTFITLKRKRLNHKALRRMNIHLIVQPSSHPCNIGSTWFFSSLSVGRLEIRFERRHRTVAEPSFFLYKPKSAIQVWTSQASNPEIHSPQHRSLFHAFHNRAQTKQWRVSSSHSPSSHSCAHWARRPRLVSRFKLPNRSIVCQRPSGLTGEPAADLAMPHAHGLSSVAKANTRGAMPTTKRSRMLAAHATVRAGSLAGTFTRSVAALGLANTVAPAKHKIHEMVTVFERLIASGVCSIFLLLNIVLLNMENKCAAWTVSFLPWKYYYVGSLGCAGMLPKGGWDGES